MSFEQGYYRRSPSLLWPLFLVIVGILLLLQNLGYLPWAFWSTAWRFWPVILILIGIQLYFGQRSPWLAAGLVALVLTLTVGGALWLSSHTPDVPGSVPAGTGAQPVTEPLNALEKASVQIQFGAGKLSLGGLNNDSTLLAEARPIAGDIGSRMSKSMRVSGGAGTLRLETKGDWINFGDNGPYWQVKLSPRIPLDLDVDVGAGEAEVDLSNFRLQRLRVQTGAGRTTIRMPNEPGRLQANVKAGVGELEVTVPEGVEARIHVQEGLSSTAIDESRFPRSGSDYVSREYEQSENRVDLIVEAGVGSIKVQ